MKTNLNSSLINSLDLKWGPIEQSEGPDGITYFRHAPPNEAFWKEWHAKKAKCIEAGLTARKTNDGEWIVLQSCDLDNSEHHDECASERIWGDVERINCPRVCYPK